MSGKAGIVHLHVGDGPRGLELVRQALKQSELPAAGLQPDPRQPAEGAVPGGDGAGPAKAAPSTSPPFRWRRGSDAWSAAEALTRYLEAGLPAERVTVSSDGGGCLPVFDGEGRVTAMDVGRPAAMAETLKELLACGQPLERVLPAFTANPARLLLLPRKGPARGRRRRRSGGAGRGWWRGGRDGPGAVARPRRGRPVECRGTLRGDQASEDAGGRRLEGTSFRWAARRRRWATSPSCGGSPRSVRRARLPHRHHPDRLDAERDRQPLRGAVPQPGRERGQVASDPDPGRRRASGVAGGAGPGGRGLPGRRQPAAAQHHDRRHRGGQGAPAAERGGDARGRHLGRARRSSAST